MSREVLRFVEHEIEGDTFGYFDCDTSAIASTCGSRTIRGGRVTLLHEVAHALYRDDGTLDDGTRNAVERFAIEASALPVQLVGSPG